MLKGIVADLAAFAAISGSTTVMGAGKSDANEVRAGAVLVFKGSTAYGCKRRGTDRWLCDGTVML